MPPPRGRRRRLLPAGVLALAVAAALVVAGCSSTDDAAVDGELLPFSEVQADDFVFEADPSSADRGVFRVTTTEPMICAIVWGETEEFGRFNNSLAMNGTGIVDHDVALPGAVPGTTYYFQVQGSTADGRQYRSETATFTIPDTGDDGAAGDRSGQGTNLALAATVVETSSVFSDAFAAENALDDDGNTEWSSDGDGDDASITIDLGEPSAVSGVEFVTRSMLDGTAIAETFTVTVDGEQTFGPFPTATPAEVALASVDFTGQTLRFDVDSSTGGNVGAVEIRVIRAN